MKKLLSFLPFLLTGCGACEEVSLPAEERAWFAPYPRAGETITFRSNRGRTVTAVVQPPKEWHTNQDCNKLESGNYQPIFVQLTLVPTEKYNDSNLSFSVNIRKHNPEKPGFLTFDMAGLQCGTSTQPGTPTAKLMPQPVTLSNGASYPAAYVFRNGQNCTSYSNARLQAFYWDKQAGLIRYELTDGEVFDLATAPD